MIYIHYKRPSVPGSFQCDHPVRPSGRGLLTEPDDYQFAVPIETGQLTYLKRELAAWSTGRPVFHCQGKLWLVHGVSESVVGEIEMPPVRINLAFEGHAGGADLQDESPGEGAVFGPTGRDRSGYDGEI